jgi:uncharacterized membrane protein
VAKSSKEADDLLKRFKKMPAPLRVVYARPRTFIAAGLGVIAIAMLPDSLRIITRLLIGWDVFVGLYVLLAIVMIARRGGVDDIRRNAALQDDGRFLMLLVTALGAFASIAAIVSELGTKNRGPTELTLAILTIALTWAAVHTTFALHYAHDYYRDDGSPGGLEFPTGDGKGDAEPDYWDFIYFSFVIGMTFQVSDVGITDKMIRRTATAHGVVSFIFNTALIALMVNIAGSAI